MLSPSTKNFSAEELRNRNKPMSFNEEAPTAVNKLAPTLGTKAIINHETRQFHNLKGYLTSKFDAINRLLKDNLEVNKDSLAVQDEALEEQKEAEYEREHQRKKFSLRDAGNKMKAGAGKLIDKAKALPKEAQGLLSQLFKLFATGYLLKKFWPMIKGELMPWLENEVFPKMGDFLAEHWKKILGGMAILSFLKSPIKWMMAPFKLALGATGFIYKGITKMITGSLGFLFGKTGIFANMIMMAKTGVSKLKGMLGLGGPKVQGPVVPPGMGDTAGKTKPVISKTGGPLKRFAGKGMGAIMKGMKGLLRVVPFLGIALLAYDLIDAFFPELWAQVGALFSVEGITEAASTIWTHVEEGLVTVGAWIGEKFSGIVDWMVGQIEQIPGASTILKLLGVDPSKARKAKEEAYKKDQLSKRDVIIEETARKERIAILDKSIETIGKFVSSKNTNPNVSDENYKNAQKIQAAQLLKMQLERESLSGKAKAKPANKSQPKPKAQPKAVPKPVAVKAPKTAPKATVAKMVTPKRGSSGSVASSDRLLLDRISRGEGTLKSGYNTTFSYGKYDPANVDITQLTLGEIKQFQNGMVANGSKSSAVGRYQFIRSTFNDVQKQLGLPDNIYFDAATQDAMILHRLKKTRGLNKWKNGGMDDYKFQENLAKEFASVASPYTNRSYYNQPVGTSTSEMQSVLRQVKGGGSSSFDIGSLASGEGGMFSPTSISAYSHTGTPGVMGGSNKSLSDIIGSIGNDGMGLMGKIAKVFGLSDKNGSIDLFRGDAERGGPMGKGSKLSGIVGDIGNEGMGLMGDIAKMMGVSDSNGKVDLLAGDNERAGGLFASLKSKLNTGSGLGRDIKVSTARPANVNIDVATKALAQKTAQKEKKAEKGDTVNNTIVAGGNAPQGTGQLTLANTKFEEDQFMMLLGTLF